MRGRMLKKVAVGVSLLFLAGCAASGMKDVRQSGFLGDYSQLKPGVGDQVAQIYFKPGVDYKIYDKLMFERVTVILSADADNVALDPATLKEMTDYYQNALFAAVKNDFQIVDTPAPGVMRVRVAITDLRPSNPVSNTLSTIVPVGIVVAGATKAVSDQNLGTGEAGTEFELLDAMTGERLAAGIDRRQGGKGVFRGKWDDTKDALDYWAKRFNTRLNEMRK